MGDSKTRSETTKCVLCTNEARTYCESDDATLCWDCDARVHSANFLVARHTRSLLCRSCHRPTAWKASGDRLPPTVSLCPRCCFKAETSNEEEDNGDYEEGETEDMEEEEEEEEEEDEGDNQVVPWGLVGPPGVSEGSSSEKEGSNGVDRSELRPMDDEPTSSKQRRKDDGDEATSSKDGRRKKSIATSCSSSRKTISTSDFIQC